MSQVIEIDPSTRIEGHAKMVLTADDEGIIQDSSFYSTSLVRGFEYLVRGRTPEFVIKLVQRICGICPIPHGLASAEAIENAIGISAPEKAHTLRELLLIANTMQSHALHQYLLIPDLPLSDEEKKDMSERIHRIRHNTQRMADIIGGEAIHPSNICVGGMYDDVSSLASAKMYRHMRECERIVSDQRDTMIVAIEKYIDNLEHPPIEYHESMLATDMNYGNRSKLDLSAISEITPYRFYDEDNPSRAGCTNIPLYYGETVEAGPRARLTLFKGFHGKTPIDINIARAREMMIYVYRALELLDELDKKGNVRTKFEYRPGEGLGVVEAPRGTDIHTVTIGEEGRVEGYNIIAPTTWNIPTTEKAMLGNHYSIAEMIMRSYDPCVECATHQIIVKDLDGHIIERGCRLG